MPKFYRKRYYRGPKDKYSIEQKAFKGTLTNFGASADPSFQSDFLIVPSASIQGMRKVKHITVNLTCDTAHVYWALVYVPGGTTASPLQVTAVGSSIYEPNQYVLNCGVVDPSAGPIRITTPLSRNLNSGDSIHLILGNETSADFFGVCRYAITLQ